MATIRISRDTASQLYACRSLTGYDRKTKKSAIIAKIKSDNGISRQTKLRINILNEESPLFLVVRDKRTDKPLTNSLPEPVIAITPGAVAEAATTPAIKTKPVAAAVAPAKKAASKTTAKAVAAKPVAKVVAAKPLPVAKKAVAKKVPVAKPVPVAKKAAAVKPLKVAPAKPVAKTLGSPTKTAKHVIEVRPSINGQKVRLGYASSEAEKAKMIAAYKASI